MNANHETLRRIQWWASLLDGVWDADVDGQAVDGKGWHKMSFWSFLSRIGLAFFLGLIPGVGFLICAVLSYFKVYRPLRDRFMFDDTDRVTLQRYSRQCFVIDLLIGLLFPVAPFLRLVFCGNLRMANSAWIRVVRHDEKCGKAFSESCLGLAAAAAEVNVILTATGSSGLLKQELTHRMTAKTIKKKPQEALQRLIIPAPPLPAKPIIPRAVTVMHFTTYPSLSPISELPEAAEAAVAKAVTPVPIPAQQQQQQPAAAVAGWHYLVGSGDEAMDEHFATRVIDAPGADEMYSVLLPHLGAQVRRNRAAEAVYRPYEITSSAEYCFTPLVAHDVEGVAEDEEEDVDDGSPPASPKEKPLTTCTLRLPWPIPKCKQHHIPPQYYYPKQGHLSDDYWRLSCPLLTGLEAISGSGATTRSGSRQGGSNSSDPNSSEDSSLGNPVDLKTMALARGCVSMSSALPVMRWRNRDVEYRGSLVGGGGFLTGENDFETDEDEDMEEDEEEELENSDSDADEKMDKCGDYEGDDEEEEGLQMRGSDLLSAGNCEFGRGGSSESGGSGG
ncbi:hypothetical protein EC957_005545 [Mortierella hygrophila]|uniref:Uncharacterized protein n=1 Tax=Mortierella hygrophila TaxID=979708 RepID=A0A9P6JZ52_9FUNG|nr:hypothetical protein EC957_005545 [Mortierella hygrophila]